MTRFAIADWAAIGPMGRTREAWRAWARGEPADDALDAPPEPPLPQSLRRRVTPIGQMALRAAAALEPTARTRFVFCSRHGEYERTFGLLGSLAGTDPVSPAEFSLSVHHALAALLSIARRNGEGHIALAAGRDSFACGLLEAIATTATLPDSPVLVVYYDAPLPESYATFRDADEVPLAVALTVTAPSAGAPAYEVALAPAEPPNTQAAAGRQALDFLRFLICGAQAARSPGERHVWQWRRVAA